MNRRTLVQSIAFVPFAAIAPHRRELRVELAPERRLDQPVFMIITAHQSADVAERYRRQWAKSPYEQFGEWYLQTAEVQQLPPELTAMPGGMMLFTARYGEAGEHIVHLVGAFRRDHITVIVRIDSNEEDLMLAIADHIGAQAVPDKFASSWSDASLRRFLPGEDIIPGYTEEPGELWP